MESKVLEGILVKLSGMQKIGTDDATRAEFAEVASAVSEILARKRIGYGDFNENHKNMYDRQALYSLHNDIQRKVVRLGNLIGVQLDRKISATEQDAIIETILDIAGYGILGLLLAIDRSDYK